MSSKSYTEFLSEKDAPFMCSRSSCLVLYGKVMAVQVIPRQKVSFTELAKKQSLRLI